MEKPKGKSALTENNPRGIQDFIINKVREDIYSKMEPRIGGIPLYNHLTQIAKSAIEYWTEDIETLEWKLPSYSDFCTARSFNIEVSEVKP